MVAPLDAGRIHSLPVQVSYHLQSSSQTFSTLFATPQQVYVHPKAGSSKGDADDETWGAIYLKAVVQGIVTASPELHPSHPGTPDHSLYILDPRETYLRRSRATPHPRTAARAGHEVWAGRGLVSWALAEPNVGKNLITGRLVRRPEFLTVAPSSPKGGLSALEALVAANESRTDDDDSEAWGIEIFVGLKSSLAAAAAFPGPLHHAVESGVVTGILEVEEDDNADSPEPAPVPRPSSISRIPSFPAARTATSSAPPRPIPRAAASSPGGPSRRKAVASKKRNAPASERSRLSSLDPNQPSTSHHSDLSEQVSNALGQITAEGRSVLTPDVLKFLEKLAGSHGAQLVAEKRAREAEEEEEKSKRARVGFAPRSEMSAPSYAPPPTVLKCANCGTTKSSVWRQQQEAGGDSVRVCNACGLYYQKRLEPRPPSMWSNDENGGRRGRGKAAANNNNNSNSSNDKSGFRRTLTQVAEKDSARIVNNRRATRAKAPVTRAKAAPQTSPVRASTYATRALRNETSNAASSPGVWQEESTTPAADPGSVRSNASASTSRPDKTGRVQSLAMPLSDDGTGANESNPQQWQDDLSAFFNVDGFAMAPGGGDDAPAAPGNSPAQGATSSAEIRGVSSVVRNGIKETAPTSDGAERSEDDIFSELFKRTSSFGQFESSPTPFDFSQLPPSSPPALPSNLPHSALLFSSPSGSPLDPSPRADSDHKPSPAQSGLRNEVTADNKHVAAKGTTGENNGGDMASGHIQDILSKLASGNSELLELFNAFPAAESA